jgi:2-(1,2-epoxy-1,2-dihydrophenyl)acetyl-CoA isomerase
MPSGLSNVFGANDAFELRDNAALCSGRRRNAMEDDPILVEIREVAPNARYRVITLNRPQRLNAFVGPLARQLGVAFDEAGRDAGCRAVLLTGAGRGFCAGQDLSERAMAPGAAPPDLGASLETWANPLIRQMRALPIPIVCAVNGVAAGAGVNLALACDIVLAARSASFLQAFARIGLMPDLGGTFFLTRLVGPARARALALLAEPLDATRAEQWGLIWKAIDDGALMEEAHALCARFCSAPPAALTAIKRGLDAAATNSLDQQLDLERDLQRELGRSGDFAEGVRAFLEKRPAAFGPRATG